MSPFRIEQVREREATIKADKAPDRERERFRRPDVEIRWERNRPKTVRIMSLVVMNVGRGRVEIIGAALREVDIVSFLMDEFVLMVRQRLSGHRLLAIAAIC